MPESVDEEKKKYGKRGAAMCIWEPLRHGCIDTHIRVDTHGCVVTPPHKFDLVCDEHTQIVTM